MRYSNDVYFEYTMQLIIFFEDSADTIHNHNKMSK